MQDQKMRDQIHFLTWVEKFNKRIFKLTFNDIFIVSG